MTPAPGTDGNPESAAPARLPRITRWLVALGVSILCIALYLFFAALRDMTATLETELAALQATLESTPAPLPELGELSSSLIQMREQAGVLEGVEATLNATHLDWTILMGAFANYEVSQLMLTGIAQSEAHIVLEGLAVNEGAIIDYTNRLRQSNLFRRVVVQSITLRTVGGSQSRVTTPPFPNENQFSEFVVAVDVNRQVE